MEPEKEDGNVEYKLKLVGATPERIQGLTSQMRYRCDEGGSECIYNLGVEDDGTQTGITEEEYKETIATLEKAVENNNYISTLLSKLKIDDTKSVYEVLIRENNEEKYTDIKILVAGSVDVGKSSFLSVLTHGKYDDGRGSARLAVFNHSHEVKSGRTSSIAQHILGFDARGEVVNYKGIGKQTWPEIVRESAKVVSFFDLAGHERYLPTTILGLTSTYGDLCFILVGANKGVLRMTKEHIFLCVSLNIPFAFVVTKIDMVKDRENVLKNTMSDINKIITYPGVRRIPVKVKTDEDVITYARNVHSESIVPIFQVSNVTGEGLDKVKSFINLLPSRKKDTNNGKVFLTVDSTFSVPGVGTVVGGQLLSGKIKVGDNLLLGPNSGTYISTQVRGIQCKRVPVQEVEHGRYVCLALRKVERNKIRKGSVIISSNGEQVVCKRFTANVSVLQAHSTTIREGKYEPVVHTHTMRQSARLVKIENKKNARKSKITNDNSILRTGDKATVTLEFCRYPEYITPGMKILLCEGRTKVVGVVLTI